MIDRVWAPDAQARFVTRTGARQWHSHALARRRARCKSFAFALGRLATRTWRQISPASSKAKGRGRIIQSALHSLAFFSLSLSCQASLFLLRPAGRSLARFGPSARSAPGNLQAQPNWSIGFRAPARLALGPDFGPIRPNEFLLQRALHLLLLRPCAELGPAKCRAKTGRAYWARSKLGAGSGLAQVNWRPSGAKRASQCGSEKGNGPRASVLQGRKFAGARRLR